MPVAAAAVLLAEAAATAAAAATTTTTAAAASAAAAAATATRSCCFDDVAVQVPKLGQRCHPARAATRSACRFCAAQPAARCRARAAYNDVAAACSSNIVWLDFYLGVFLAKNGHFV